MGVRGPWKSPDEVIFWFMALSSMSEAKGKLRRQPRDKIKLQAAAPKQPSEVLHTFDYKSMIIFFQKKEQKVI